MSGSLPVPSFGEDFQAHESVLSELSPKLALDAVRLIEDARSNGLAEDVIAHLLRVLAGAAAEHPCASRVFACFFRFISATRNPISFVSLLERDADTLVGLTRLFAAAPELAEDLISDPEVLDLLRITGGQPVDSEYLFDEIAAECGGATTVSHAQAILRRFQRRETLRIVYGELAGGVPIERTGQQFASVADAILSAAIDFVGRQISSRRGVAGQAFEGSIQPRLAVIALGAFGGQELSLRRRLGVMFVCPDFLPSQPEHQMAREFVEQWIEGVVSLLSKPEGNLPIYELNHRFQFPHQGEGRFQLTDWLRAFETSGRTWQRLALVKARFAAGDRTLANEFFERITPWIYRRYLWAFDQEGMRGLKRKLAKGAQDSSGADQGVSELTATLSEITDVLQLLQLLNGSDVASIRNPNTFYAIELLEQSGCLTMQERSLLTEHLIALKRLELRCEMASDGGASCDVWGTAAATLDLIGADGEADSKSLLTEFHQRRNVCRRIMDHLVHEVFSDVDELPFETEMILDPDVDVNRAQEVIAGYGFQHPEAAWQNLLALATEPIRFLSDRRARHFFAGIAPRLLEEFSTTPFPDAALERLVAVSDSLGGKAALWELFQTTPSTLRLGVRLSAASPYLTSLLTHNPGMVDELIDSLVLDRLPTEAELEQSSADLCKYAEEIDPIVHSFKDSAHLRIGVRDCLGRDSIQETHRGLAATAESCLRRIAEDEFSKMCDRYGVPYDDGNRQSVLTIVALGRLGGREPNYHSDLDVIFLYDRDGLTRTRGGARREGTTNSHFFNEMTQRLHKRIGHYGAQGRLYELDSRIRFSPLRGLLAITVDQFRQHFASANCPLWERLALVNARVIFSSGESPIDVWQEIRHALLAQPWDKTDAQRVAQLRYASQQGASTENLKRGIGGTLDIEAIVQMLLLKNARHWDGELGVGTLEGLEKLRSNGFIEMDVAQQLSASYRYLRCVESNLRLMDLPARHDLPQSTESLRWLAYAMRESNSGVVVQKCEQYRRANRALFDELIAKSTQE